jgi:predicted nucleotidyltransferase
MNARDLERRIARIFAPVHPLRIVLFGSRARGDADEASDVDLIVVYRTERRFLDRLAELYRLWDLPLAVDILAYTPEEFDRLVQESEFVREAMAQGRPILEAA